MKLTKKNYVETAEKVILALVEEADLNRRNVSLVTTSKIRKILSMVSDIYNDACQMSGNTLDDEMIGRIQYLKMHIVYEAGRDKKAVKPFVKKANLLSAINDIGDSREQLILFCHYMEALVAYRKYHGKRDD